MTEYNVYYPSDYGGFWRRSLGDFIDGIILVIAFAFINAALNGVTGMHYAVDIILNILGIILNILIFPTYMIWYQVGMGATPGYQILGMEIVAINGTNVTVKQIVIRLISSIFSALVFSIGYIWVAFDANKQAWHDKVAGTYVIRKGVTRSATLSLWSGVIRYRWFSFQVLCLAVLVGFFVNQLFAVKRSVTPIVEKYLYAMEHDNYQSIKYFSGWDKEAINQLRRLHVMATDGFGVRQNIQVVAVGFQQSFSKKEGNISKVSCLVEYELGKIQIDFRLKKDGERYTIENVTYYSDLLKDDTLETLESAGGQGNPP